MVLNLLQRFSLDEAKELIFKTFGYFSSTDRLTPLLNKKEKRLEDINLACDFVCKWNLSDEDFENYNKLKSVEARKKSSMNFGWQTSLFCSAVQPLMNVHW